VAAVVLAPTAVADLEVAADPDMLDAGDRAEVVDVVGNLAEGRLGPRVLGEPGQPAVVELLRPSGPIATRLPPTVSSRACSGRQRMLSGLIGALPGAYVRPAGS